MAHIRLTSITMLFVSSMGVVLPSAPFGLSWFPQPQLLQSQQLQGLTFPGLQLQGVSSPLAKPLGFLSPLQQPVNAAPLLPENSQLQLGGLPQQLANAQAAQMPPEMGQQNIYAPAVVGLPQQPANVQAPYAPSLLESPQQLVALQGPNDLPSMQSTVATLQAQLAAERNNELLLSNMATKKEEALVQMNQSFTHIQSLAQAGVEHERQLQTQLDNVSSVNDVLRTELAKIQDQDSREATELFNEQSQVSLLQDKLREAESVKGHALKVMKDVRVAQEKVRHTEDLLRNLIPALTPEKPSPPPSQLTQDDLAKALAILSQGNPSQQLPGLVQQVVSK